MHVLGGAFKQPTAAACKEGVATKHQWSNLGVIACVVVPQDKCDVGRGVGCDIHNLKPSPKQVDGVAIGNARCLKRNSEPICSGCNDLCLGPFEQKVWGATDVISVMVGLQDRGQAHPVILQPLRYRIRHGWIHDDGVPAPGPDPNHVVV